MGPIRCCVACKSRKDKKEFFRIVADNEKKAIIDKNQNINSRGIYICKDKKCIESLKKAINKNKVKIKIDINDCSLLEVLEELGEVIWEK